MKPEPWPIRKWRFLIIAFSGLALGGLSACSTGHSDPEILPPPTHATTLPMEEVAAGAVPRFPKLQFSQIGPATFYGREHQGMRTANGERFDMNGFTAAHRTLPFGTVARVTRIDTGRTVTVRINDRGPFGGPEVIDLSAAAAHELGMTGAGPKVRIEVYALEQTPR